MCLCWQLRYEMGLHGLYILREGHWTLKMFETVLLKPKCISLSHSSDKLWAYRICSLSWTRASKGLFVNLTIMTGQRQHPRNDSQPQFRHSSGSSACLLYNYPIMHWSIWCWETSRGHWSDPVIIYTMCLECWQIWSYGYSGAWF